MIVGLRITIVEPRITIVWGDIAIVGPHIAIVEPRITIVWGDIAIVGPHITIVGPRIAIVGPRITIVWPCIAIVWPCIAFVETNVASAVGYVVLQPFCGGYGWVARVVRIPRFVGVRLRINPQAHSVSRLKPTPPTMTFSCSLLEQTLAMSLGFESQAVYRESRSPPDA